MNRRTVLIIGGTIVLFVALVAGWYLLSPLFIDDAVDEAFPFEVPAEAAVAAMSDDEMKSLESEFMTAVPAESELDQLSEADRAQVEERVVEAAATVMADHEMDDSMPESADEWIAVASGRFVGADSFHQGEGTATIFVQGEERVLRFEEFEVTNGPDLHVILTRDPNPTDRAEVGEDYIDLGSLKGNIGNQNYAIAADLDLEAYQGVVIYCVPFHVVFATAALSP